MGTIKQNSDNASQTEKIALKSAEDAKQGGAAVQKSVRAIKNKKLTVWRAYRRNSHDSKLKMQYNKLCAQYKRAVRDYEIDCERKGLESNIVGDFYKYVNKKLTYSSGVGVLKDKNGQCAVSDSERAELLNSFLRLFVP